MNDIQYPVDDQLRPVEYTSETHEIVRETCKAIQRKHRVFIENASIDFESFESECAERVWKGLKNQFKGGSSVKTYVYIICANHWRNTVHKFFVRVKNYNNFTSNLLLSPCSGMVNIEIANSENPEEQEQIPLLQMHPEYIDENDHDHTVAIIRKFVWFVYRKHKSNMKMARAIVRVFDGEPITKVAKQQGVTLKSLNAEVNKFGTVYRFNDEKFEFEVV